MVLRVLFVFFLFNLRVWARVPLTPRDLVHQYSRYSNYPGTYLTNCDMEQQAIVSFPSCATIQDSLICLTKYTWLAPAVKGCVSLKKYPPPPFKHLSNSQALVVDPDPDPSPICSPSLGIPSPTYTHTWPLEAPFAD